MTIPITSICQPPSFFASLASRSSTTTSSLLLFCSCHFPTHFSELPFLPFTRSLFLLSSTLSSRSWRFFTQFLGHGQLGERVLHFGNEGDPTMLLRLMENCDDCLFAILELGIVQDISVSFG